MAKKELYDFEENTSETIGRATETPKGKREKKKKQMTKKKDQNFKKKIAKFSEENNKKQHKKIGQKQPGKKIYTLLNHLQHIEIKNI